MYMLRLVRRIFACFGESLPCAMPLATRRMSARRRHSAATADAGSCCSGEGNPAAAGTPWTGGGGGGRWVLQRCLVAVAASARAPAAARTLRHRRLEARRRASTHGGGCGHSASMAGRGGEADAAGLQEATALVMMVSPRNYGGAPASGGGGLGVLRLSRCGTYLGCGYLVNHDRARMAECQRLGKTTDIAVFCKPMEYQRYPSVK